MSTPVKKNPKVYKVVVLGDGGVGKTALTVQLCHNQFVETYDPTIEDSYRKTVVIDEEQCILEILDTAGQEEYTSLRDQWIRDGQGFLLVYSITSQTSFNRVAKFYNQIQRVKDSSSFPCILVGNKCDCEEQREVTKEEAEVLAKKMKCPILETSAKLNINAEKAFFDVVRLYWEITRPKKNTTKQEKQVTKKKVKSKTSKKKDCIVM